MTGLLLLMPAIGASQKRDTLAALEGHIRDATDSGAVSFAEVRIAGTRLRVRANGVGHFRISNIPTGAHEFTVRALGYAPVALPDTFLARESRARDVYLVRIPRMLSQMEVRGKYLRVPAGFETVYRRGARGLGAFITREQIDSQNPRDVRAVLNSVPFIRVEPTHSGFNSVVTQRCRSVEVWLNGIRVGDTSVINTVLYHTTPSSIQVVEVYDGGAGRMPVEFMPACGVVAVWTRKG